MPDTQISAVDRAREYLRVFRRLNPELVDVALPKLEALVPELGPAFFDEAADFAGELLELYVTSPVKRAEQNVLADFHVFLDRATRQLVAAGELPDVTTGEPVTASVSLVPADFYTPLQWFKVNASSEVPKDVVHAVDAAKRRNHLVHTVLEPFFQFMLQLDHERAVVWQLKLCSDESTPIDPDVARDLIRVWRTRTDLPPTALRQAKVWSDDRQAFRHWPSVVEEADRLLREYWFRTWVAKMPPATVQARHLQLLYPFTDGNRMLRWLKNCVDQTGAAIDFFIFESSKLAQAGEGDDAEITRAALYRQLLWIDQMIPPLVVLADLILNTPNGAFEFALSLFGFTTEHRQGWGRVLDRHCAEAVHRRFLADLRSGSPPAKTIKMLSFGDEVFEAEVMAELDALTGDFDSLAQRDIVVEKLTAMYASSREQKLLNTEIGRRYRRLMQVLHQDNIRRLLSDEQFEAIDRASGPLRDLSAIAAAGRKYLSSRRALNRTTEEILAEEEDFVSDIRNLRSTYIQRVLL